MGSTQAATPPEATDFTDDGFKITYYRRVKAFNMDLLEYHSANGWEMAGCLPWDKLQPVVAHSGA